MVCRRGGCGTGGRGVTAGGLRPGGVWVAGVRGGCGCGSSGGRKGGDLQLLSSLLLLVSLHGGVYVPVTDISSFTMFTTCDAKPLLQCSDREGDQEEPPFFQVK